MTSLPCSQGNLLRQPSSSEPSRHSRRPLHLQVSRRHSPLRHWNSPRPHLGTADDNSKSEPWKSGYNTQWWTALDKVIMSESMSRLQDYHYIPYLTSPCCLSYYSNCWENVVLFLKKSQKKSKICFCRRVFRDSHNVNMDHREWPLEWFIRRIPHHGQW